MKPDIKLVGARANVADFLREAERRRPEITKQFPRPVEEILGLSPMLIEVVSVSGLRMSVVKERVQALCGDRLDHEPDDAPVGGYTYGRGEGALVFCETNRGVAYARFSLAHEGFHIWEHWCRVQSDGKQLALFSQGTAAHVTTAHRDPHENFEAHDVESRTRPVVHDRATWLREVRANAFAAELLMPTDDVMERSREFLKSNPSWGSEELVRVMKHRYLVSARAMKIRLEELGIIHEQSAGGRLEGI